MMEFRENATVVTADGDEVGRLERVVLDPYSKEITHLVIRRGAFFTEDRVIPVDLVASAAEDRITLEEDIGDLKELPYFEVEKYVNLSQEEIERAAFPPDFVRPVYWYPAVGVPPVGYPGYPGPPHIVRTERNIPDYTVALEEDARVISADGKHVGNVERVITGSADNIATHFLISKGILFREHKLVPVSWVDRIEEEQIHLAVGSSLLEALPEYEE
jgi:uncharacterized protein YrrD